MITQRIDKSLDDLIVNLKLTKPSSVDAFRKISQTRTQPIQHLPTFNTQFQQKHSIIKNNPIIEEDSLINDNYDDFNCYSFYELKDSLKAKQQTKPQQFSFCHQVETINDTQNDSISRFSSIVDKLKTEGDSLDDRDSHFFYSVENYPDEKNTQRMKFSNEFYCGEVQKPKNTQRRHAEYFSDSMVKSTNKNYKILAKRTLQQNLTKHKLQPIYAKLTLPIDKQNNHHNSNIAPKSSLMSDLSSKRSTYSSTKKPISISKNNSKQLVDNSWNKQRIKELNQKIRKENHIIYQSEFKQKTSDSTPLRSFKKPNIQPHKFSSYKIKLFG